MNRSYDDSNSRQTSKDRSWMLRTFSKMQMDSLRSSIFTMLITALGTGMFTLHHVYNGIGVVWGILMFFLFAGNYILSCRFLAFAAVKAGNQCKSLNDLVNHYYGKGFLYIYTGMFIVNCLIVLISMILAITKTFYNNFKDLIWNLIQKIIVIPEEQRNYPLFNKFAVYVVGFLVFFLTVPKEIGILRYFSLVSFSIVLGIVIVVIVQSPAYYNNVKQDNSFNIVEFDFSQCLQVFGLAVYSYNCITNFYAVYSSIKQPTEQRVNKVFGRTFILLFFLFASYATASYFSLGRKFSDQTDLFIFRKKLNEGDSDIFMVIFRGLLVITLFVGFAINVYPLKLITLRLLDLEDSRKSNLLVSLVWTVVPVIIAGLFDNVTKYANIGGCFTSITIAFIAPGLLALKAGYTKKTWTKYLLIIWILVMVVLMGVGTYLAIKDFVKPVNN